jgi:hypothetical protein
MWGRCKKRRQGGPSGDEAISDAAVAKQMRSLADAFIRSCAADGYAFGWDGQSVAGLDDFCDVFVESEPSTSRLEAMIMGMSAYLGEVIVRNGGGRWTYYPGQPPAIHASSEAGLFFPMNKVGKRLTIGPEHSLSLFCQVVTTGEVPPGAVRTPRDPIQP